MLSKVITEIRDEITIANLEKRMSERRKELNCNTYCDSGSDVSAEVTEILGVVITEVWESMSSILGRSVSSFSTNSAQLGKRSSECVSRLANICERTPKPEIFGQNLSTESIHSEGVEDLLAEFLEKMRNEIIPATLDEILSSPKEREIKSQSDMEQDVQGPEPLWKSNSQGITEVLLKVLDKVKNELVGVMSEESVFTKKSSATYYSENNVEKFNSVVEELGRVDSDFFIDLTTKDITEVLLDIVHEIKCDLMSNDTKEQLPSREGRSEITQSPGSTWNAKYFSSLQPTLAETKLQLDPTSTSMTATPLHEMELTLTTTSSCVPDKRPTQETCLVGQEITTLTPEGHKTELIETSENTTSTETKDILHHDVTPESSLLSPSTTHISENQFEIASSTTCVTLTPEEQKLTLSETNLQFHPDDKSVTATGERSVKETCLIGQETSTLTPEGDEAGLTETSEKIASGITCATLTSEEQKPTPAETNMEFNQSETSVTTPSSYITDKGSEKETCLFGQDTTTLTPVGHETELTKTGDKISSDTTCATLTPEEQKLTLAETNLQFDQSETSITTTSSCIPDKMPTEETCLVVQKTSTLTPEEHETELTETNENATPTETKDILHHDVTPESSLLSPSTTHISENQFEIASSTTCVTLKPEEQKLTLAETNLQFHLDDKSVTATSSLCTW